ncbi:MAG: hypothetical protein EOP53_20620 [Sphingobacteriales bacterium]|nr:MAG: hypothetical protein EOP53_20620 [Sphingobacteriales bacterium]
MKKQITDLKDLQIEKERLKALSEAQLRVVKDDIAWIKEEYAPMELLNKAASSVVPEPVRHSSLVNTSINYIAKTLFHKERNVVSTESDKGSGNRMRNIALGVAEGLGTYLITKYIRRKL